MKGNVVLGKSPKLGPEFIYLFIQQTYIECLLYLSPGNTIIKKKHTRLDLCFQWSLHSNGANNFRITDEIIIFSVTYILYKCCPTEIKRKPYI